MWPEQAKPNLDAKTLAQDDRFIRAVEKLRSISIQASRSECRVIFDCMNRKLIPYGTKLPVAFTNKELGDIRNCLMIDEEWAACRRGWQTFGSEPFT
jgi:hypothetical protein